MLAFSWILNCLLVLLSVAFFTLFERKVIGLFHLRFGPNKVTFLGLLQPLLDAFKLLTKQNLIPYRANKMVYHSAPHMALFISLMVWLCLPMYYLSFRLSYSFVLFFCVGSLIVFPVLLAGWASNSKYRLIGRLRSIAQSISYESVFRTLLILIIFLIHSYRIKRLLSISSLVYIFLIPLWVISTLAETHRAPFDFRESERELVSGFNTEYSGCYFAFIFLSEYSILLFSCLLISNIFFGWFLSIRWLLVVLGGLFISFVFIWIRVTFCRFRYDILISLSWKTLLPLTLCFFFLYVSLRLII